MIEDTPHPLGYQVQSSSNPWEWYLVDLEPEPGKPSGDCECKRFTTHVLPMMRRGSVLTTCKHILEARDRLRERIAEGEFDECLLHD